MAVRLAVDPRCHTLRLPSDGHGDERAIARPTGPRAPSRCATPWPRPRPASRWRRSPSWCRPTTSAWPPGGCCPRARSGPVAGAGVGLAAVAFLTTYRLAELLGAAALAGQGRRPVSTPVLAAAVRAELAAQPGPVRAGRRAPRHRVGARGHLPRAAATSSPAALDAIAGAQRPRARGRAPPPGRPRPARAAAGTTRRTCSPRPPTSAGSPAAAALGALVVHLPAAALPAQRSAARGRWPSTCPPPSSPGSPACPTPTPRSRASLRRLGVSIRRRRRGRRPRAGRPGPHRGRHRVRRRRGGPRRGAGGGRRRARRHPARPHRRAARQPRALRPPGPRAAPRRRASPPTAPPSSPSPRAWPAARCSSCSPSRPAATGARTCSRGCRRRRSSTTAAWRPPRAWERLSREAAVVAGRDDWDHRLTQLAPRNEEHARRGRARRRRARVGAERGCARRPSRARELQRLRARRDRRPGGRGRRARAAGASTPRGRSAGSRGCSAARRAASGGTTRPSARPPSGSSEALAPARRARRRRGPGVRSTCSHRTLELELEHDLGRVGRFGDGVLVGSVEMGIGLDLDLVVVLGLAEGSFPATVRDDSLLPDHERAARRRRAGAAQPTGSSASTASSSPPWPARAASSSCVPRGDLRRSVERVPSRWVLDLCTAPRRRGVTVVGARPPADADVPWVRHVASFDAGLRHLDVPATAQEHRLRALLAAGGDARAATDDAATAARRRGDRRPAQRPLHPLRRQPRRPAGAVAGRPHHLAHPPRALGRLPPPPPRRGPAPRRARSRTPRTTS